MCVFNFCYSSYFSPLAFIYHIARVAYIQYNHLIRCGDDKWPYYSSGPSHNTGQTQAPQRRDRRSFHVRYLTAKV